MSLLRRRNAALLLMLAVAGCGGAAGTGGEASKDTKKAAAPLTEDEYQALLDRAGKSVSAAAAGVKSARSRDSLTERLEKSATALEKTVAEFEGSAAPTAVAAGHKDALVGLQAYAAAFSSAAGSVGSGGVCTAPAALAQITRSEAAGDLRSAAAVLREGGFSVKGLAPQRQKKPSVRLKSGVLFRAGGTGPGKLVIQNGNPGDGVVKITAPGGKRMSIFVRGKGTATVDGVPDGTFKTYFATGVSWDGKRNTFSRKCGFSRFDDPMKFTSGGGQYTQFTISLNAVAGGNAPSSEIDPDDFPKD